MPRRVRPDFASSSEIIRRAAKHDLPPVIEEMLDELLEVEDLRLVVDHTEEIDAEGGPHLGQRIEVVLHDLGHRVALELDDDADPVAIRFVTDVDDALDALVADEPAATAHTCREG